MTIFQIIAVLYLILFYGCYISKMLLQRSHGIKTDHMGEGKTGFVRGVEIALKAATYLVAAASIVSIVVNISLLTAWIRWIGVVIGALGVISFVSAVITMKDSWRAGVSRNERTKLVTDGIFQISRNPAFLGFDLLYVGILFMFFNWPLFIASVFAMLVFHLQIVNVEEDFLLETFGEDYLRYKKKVHRYLGRKHAV